MEKTMQLRRVHSELLKGSEKCQVIRRSQSAPELSLPKLKESRVIEELKQIEDKLIPRLAVWDVIDPIQAAALLNSDKEQSIRLITCILQYRGLSGLNLKLLSIYLYDAFCWAADNKYDIKKISAFLGVLYNTHEYFLESPYRTHKDVYIFCRESLVLHSTEFPPKAERILHAFESRDMLVYFCGTYLPIVPLLRISLLPNYRLQIRYHIPLPDLQETVSRKSIKPISKGSVKKINQKSKKKTKK